MPDIEHVVSTDDPESLTAVLTPFHVQGDTECARCAKRLKAFSGRAYWWQQQRFCASCIHEVCWPACEVRVLCAADYCRLCCDEVDALHP